MTCLNCKQEVQQGNLVRVSFLKPTLKGHKLSQMFVIFCDVCKLQLANKIEHSEVVIDAEILEEV